MTVEIFPQTKTRPPLEAVAQVFVAIRDPDAAYAEVLRRWPQIRESEVDAATALAVRTLREQSRNIHAVLDELDPGPEAA